MAKPSLQTFWNQTNYLGKCPSNVKGDPQRLSFRTRKILHFQMPKEEKHFWDETRKPWMDREGEQRAVKPTKTAKNHARANENTGKASQRMAGYFQDMVMEQAVKDFEKQAMPKKQDCCPNGENGHHGKGTDEAHEAQMEAEEVEEKLEDDIEVIRQKRLQQLMKESALKNKFLSLGHGQYSEIEEADFLKCCTESPRVVVHFYHKDFRRCAILDGHLRNIAPAALGCRFVRINAEKAPFFVEKLKVKILPSAIFFINGIATHRVTGFAELVGGDEFRTEEFVKILEEHRMLEQSSEAAVAGIAEAQRETTTRTEFIDDEEFEV